MEEFNFNPNDQNQFSPEFNKEFNRTRKNIKRGIKTLVFIWFLLALVSLGVTGVIVWAVIRLVLAHS
jgi:cytochrome b subunit of formate dehydrogenase